MADDNIIALNVPEVARALAEYPDLVAREFRPASEAALLGLIPEVATYPGGGSSSYTRTGTLGRTWTSAQPEYVSMIFGGFHASIGNATPYGHWVQGDDQAQALGARGWKKVEAIAQGAKGRIEGYYAAAAQKVAGIINRITAH